MDQVDDFVLASAAFPWVYALVFAWVLIDGFFPPVPSDVVIDRSVARFETRHDLRRNTGIRAESPPGKAISPR